ncbi:hypothetical protein [Nocardiopsis halotolerans]|uniref:hypothetical protein n=1 Tax=Nocardiopsis halotolerans TaxID=124252 RepID=UPI001267F44D|nr:hypothetical protein [Nocardiopsis halotolerans]
MAGPGGDGPADGAPKDRALLADVGPLTLTHHRLAGRAEIPDDHVAQVVDILLTRFTRDRTGPEASPALPSGGVAAVAPG